MITINPYLNFNGNCEEAFEFYKSVFGGEFSHTGRFADMPAEQPLPAADARKIMHISLPISKETVLMGCDTLAPFCPPVKQGDNISITINAIQPEEARRLFQALSQGGKVTMPMEEQFWGALFGAFTDRFGIQWMINCDLQGKQ